MPQQVEPRIVTEFPRRVRQIEHVWIPMADGVRLSARLWLPEDAEADPVPAILEYIPYRKRDGSRLRDDAMHGWWAGHGYASVRLDVRGTGESEGRITDEYTEAELSDGVTAIAWIAAQSWCTGKVGMTGISWGGFNSLQVAALRPPALKAIITHCSTDDRYADDVHFMGGCLGLDNFFWAAGFFQFMARPADPAIQGDRWREQWRERLEGWEPVTSTIWLRHQRRDAYWKHGSVCESYDDITCAVYAVGGWEDGYSNAVPRMLANLSCPRKGLVGAWGHKYPHIGIPGPAVGYLQDSLRWWDHWLKDADNGVMDEPMYRAWMREPSVPDALLQQTEGRWIAEDNWPSGRAGARRWTLLAAGNTARTHRAVQSVGFAGGSWCPYGLGGSSPDLAIDQSEDDARSLVFETDLLDERTEFLGQPVVNMTLEVDRPQAFVAVRLVDVAPDGTAARVTYQILNLTHRNDHETLCEIPVGRAFDVAVRLNDMAWSFPAGHRIRVAVSTSYWPIIWPSPEAVTLRVTACTLELPAREPRPDDGVVPFEAPEMAPLSPRTEIEPASSGRVVTRDLATGEWVINLVEEGGVWRFDDIDLEVAEGIRVEYRIRDGDPLSARGCWRLHSRRKREGWDIEVRSQMAVSATLDSFQVDTTLDALDEGETFFSRTWNHVIPRDGV